MPSKVTGEICLVLRSKRELVWLERCASDRAGGEKWTPAIDYQGIWMDGSGDGWTGGVYQILTSRVWTFVDH